MSSTSSTFRNETPNRNAASGPTTDTRSFITTAGGAIGAVAGTTGSPPLEMPVPEKPTPLPPEMPQPVLPITEPSPTENPIPVREPPTTIPPQS